AATPGHSSSSVQPSSKRALIVEDDPASASAMVGILKRYGLTVVTATTVQGALAALNHEFDYVILDLMLPDGDGAEVLRRMRDGNSSAWVCVITAPSDPAMLAAIQRLNPGCILRKPIDV